MMNETEIQSLQSDLVCKRNLAQLICFEHQMAYGKKQDGALL